MWTDKSLRPESLPPEKRLTTNGHHPSLIPPISPSTGSEPGLEQRAGHSPAIEAGQAHISIAELAFIVGLATVIAVGWLGLVLAQLGWLSRTNLLLALSAIAVLADRGSRIADRGSRIADRTSATGPAIPGTSWVPQSAIRDPQSAIRNPHWHAGVLAGILVLAALLYTPPADYAPAFLDAGWYTNVGALIARTGALTTRPAVLEDLPAGDRELFIRTYHDLKASLPQFPDRRDFGFYNLTFAIDLGRDGPVVPYHPPLASIWIAILRLLGGHELSTYAAPMFGLLFVLAVYAAGRAIFGSNISLVGALLTALAPPVVYYARTPFAELFTGAMIWAGVYAITRYATLSSQISETTQTPAQKHTAPRLRSPAPLLPCSPAPLLLLAGLAFGAAFLAKLESVLLLAPITLFWLIWLHQRWATHRDFVAFLAPFGLLLGHATLLHATTLQPYVMLNGHGILSILATAISRPMIWTMLTAMYAGGVITLVAVRHRKRLAIRNWRWIPRTESSISNLHFQSPNLRAGVSLVILAGAGIVLLRPGSAFTTLGLFLTPLGLCLGIVGFSTLIEDELNRRSAFLVMLICTAGLITLVMPAISSHVSHLYTVRRQLPIVIPALLLLAGYVALRWAGLARSGEQPGQPPAGLRRGLVILLLALLAISFLDATRPLLGHQELAGSSIFIANLAESFDADDIVLFESVERGAHVGRFAAPLWTAHGLSAMVFSSTYPPTDRLQELIQRWQEQGRHVYFVSQSQPPPFSLPNFDWELVDKKHWAGSTMAAKMNFPPESWVMEVSFYIYGVKAKRN